MNKNKGFIGMGLILAIILGIIAAGGAYYLGKGGFKQGVNNLPIVGSQPINIPSITILSPNGGEQLTVGSKYVIKYQSNLAPEDAIVFLFIGLNGKDEWLKIDPGYSDNLSATSGSYEWTIPKEICGVEVCTPLISGENYKLKAVLTGTVNNQFQDITSDISDNPFTINSEISTANFNGHYVITGKGCGTGVTCYSITDKITGKVYVGPSDDYGNTGSYSGDENFNKTRWSINSNIFKVIGYTSIDSYKFENEKFTKIGSTPFPCGSMGCGNNSDFKNPPISTTLPTKYLDSQNWPPVIKTSGFAYSCKISSGSGDVPTVVEEKIINGKKYCVTSLMDAGAGSRFGEYTYTTPSTSGSGTKTTSFNLRWSSCGAYDKPESDQCQTTVSTFLNKLDVMVDSIMSN